ncbi:MAG: hypothetical protein Q9187_003162 [Circinaria calcarea]
MKLGPLSCLDRFPECEEEDVRISVGVEWMRWERMYYDLNVPWSADQLEIQRILAFLAEHYNVVALNHTISGKLPTDVSCPIPNPLPFTPPAGLRLLRRCTLVLTDPSQNHRLSTLASNYDLLALRPTTEKALLQACQSIEGDLISLDLSTRFPFHFKQKTLSIAIQRGIKFEICYGSGVLVSDGGMARRNLISNATQLIRATRGRGIVISSEAKKALACRGPEDVVNLAAIWGLGQERGREAVGREAKAVAVQAEMRRRSFKGVIDVVYGGERPQRGAEVVGKAGNAVAEGKGKGKRKAEVLEGVVSEVVDEVKPISKREQKRRAKKARIEGDKNEGVGAEKAAIVSKPNKLPDRINSTIIPNEAG